MADVSKMVADWGLVIRTVTSALDRYGPELATRLEAELFPDGAPPNLTMEMLFDAWSAWLKSKHASVEGYDRALAAERSDDDGVRQDRDVAHAALRQLFSGVRSLVEGAYGSRGAVRVGVAGRLPDSPDQLRNQAETAANLLESDVLGEPLVGDGLDGAALAAQLRRGASDLQSALRRVHTEVRDEQAALRLRDDALVDLGRSYSGLADMTVGAATIAGRDDIADHTRPTARRRDGLPEPEDELHLEPVEPADPANPAQPVDPVDPDPTIS